MSELSTVRLDIVKIANYECVDPNSFDKGREPRGGIERWIGNCNVERLYSHMGSISNP